MRCVAFYGNRDCIVARVARHWVSRNPIRIGICIIEGNEPTLLRGKLNGVGSSRHWHNLGNSARVDNRYDSIGVPRLFLTLAACAQEQTHTQ